jgi:hypothetical protein
MRIEKHFIRKGRNIFPLFIGNCPKHKPGPRIFNIDNIFFTRSYYRKKSAASPPRDQNSMRNLLNVWGCLYDPALPGRDMRRDDFNVLK